MRRTAPTQANIHDLVKERWSPYVFDADRSVSEQDLRALFEAARWTMSSYNAQPWRYIVGVRERSYETWKQILGVLLEANQVWAGHAPVLAIGLAEHLFEHNGKENKASIHDLGAASACLTLEATARGLSVHQMIGIDPSRVSEVFEIPPSTEPFTALAIGYAGDAGHTDLDQEYANRDARERERKPISEIVIYGGF
jgi:nitroreductase